MSAINRAFGSSPFPVVVAQQELHWLVKPTNQPQPSVRAAAAAGLELKRVSWAADSLFWGSRRLS